MASDRNCKERRKPPNSYKRGHNPTGLQVLFLSRQTGNQFGGRYFRDSYCYYEEYIGGIGDLKPVKIIWPTT